MTNFQLTWNQTKQLSDLQMFAIQVHSLQWSGFQLSVVKPNPKQSLWPITKHMGNPEIQSKLKVIICS